MNKALSTAIAGIGIAQALKVPFHYAKTGRWKWSKAFDAGGMPSSHAAGAASLATSVALKRGVASVEFAISSLFGLIVMYDAMGVRRRTGEIAVEVNDLDAAVEKLAERHPGIYHRKRDKELKEMIGHLPREVVGGCLLGVAVGLCGHLTGKPK
ncbi:divergent PAP2 family protein [Paenibacillus flagellatus]|uniref:Acid phosphatase n=1 Tax=Paenibacillus flagellatus TaxID=2211139 RepID=A0A2V5K5E6_9BACL|nr:divergent PAP2 family protein [Paenibacillus flagellatus]PYI54478.1 acid phosphatase [Paenibacillus flagellatus]